METIVLILAYNEEEHVERAIKSVIDQEDKDVELYFVDDASTDSTLTKAEALLSQSGLKYQILANPKNIGVVKSAMVAFKEFSDRDCFLVRLDADDALTPNSIRDLKAAYQPGHLVTGGYWEEAHVTARITPQHIGEFLACGVLMYIPDIVKVGGLAKADVGIFIEYDLYYRLIAIGVKPLVIDEVVYAYYRQPNSLTRDSEAVQGSLQALKDHWGDELVSKIRRY